MPRRHHDRRAGARGHRFLSSPFQGGGREGDDPGPGGEGVRRRKRQPPGRPARAAPPPDLPPEGGRSQGAGAVASVTSRISSTAPDGEANRRHLLSSPFQGGLYIRVDSLSLAPCSAPACPRVGPCLCSDVLVRVRRARAGILVCFLAGRGRRRGPVKKLGKGRALAFKGRHQCLRSLSGVGGFRRALFPVCLTLRPILGRVLRALFPILGRNPTALFPVLGRVRLAGTIDPDRGQDASKASDGKYPMKRFHSLPPVTQSVWRAAIPRQARVTGGGPGARTLPRKDRTRLRGGQAPMLAGPACQS